MREAAGPALCPECGGDLFRLPQGSGVRHLACAGCGRVAGDLVFGDELAELRRDIASLREEMSRLRQAVNFLNQRVR